MRPTAANTQLGLYALCAISNQSRTSLAVTVAALNRFDAILSLLRLEKTLDGAWIVGNATSSPYRWRLGQTFSAQSTCYLEALALDALEGVGAAVRRAANNGCTQMSDEDGHCYRAHQDVEW
jgi:hypothetical protein